MKMEDIQINPFDIQRKFGGAMQLMALEDKTPVKRTPVNTDPLTSSEKAFAMSLNRPLVKRDPLRNLSNSKLPAAILESFKKNPPAPEIMPAFELPEEFKAKKETPQPINEQIVPQVNNAATVDYSLIKMIVEECIRKYANSLKNTIVNESKQNAGSPDDTIRVLKLGENFKFVTENGDIYESVLTYKGNVREKSKKKTK
jgi:hypothetical protein